jgi:hypothetical protein
VSWAEIEAEANRIGRASVGRVEGDRLAPANVRAVLRSARKQAIRNRRPPKYAKVIDQVGITPAELALLPGLQKRGNVGRPSRRKAERAARRASIRQIMAQLGYTPSTRRMAQQLAASGFTTTQRTVASDYQALGLVAANMKGGRPSPALPFSENAAA